MTKTEPLYGPQTARAVVNFAIGDERFPREFIAALGMVKQAAARTNLELGVLPSTTAHWIDLAAAEVISGALDDEFPLSIWQSGSGTQTNMNANEVIANRAMQLAGTESTDADAVAGPIHPNDHVNRSQSSNDVFPTAMHLAAAGQIDGRLKPALRGLRDGLREAAAPSADLVKLGRTHLMDAVPLTWGQEVSGWISQLDHGIDRLDAALDGLYELALGGTAVGTGLNAPAGFGERAVAALAAASGLPLRPAANRFEAIAASDAVVFASGALKTLAASLMKIANDVRLLASGPRAGIGELRIPANEPGSSIMPGKVNPTQCEALAMVCAQVFGNDAAITVGGASGLLQLNVARPLMIFNLLRSIRLLADAVASFHHRCVVGMEPLRAPTAEHVAASLMLVTALVPRLGYDAAARIATRAHAEGTTLKAAAIALGLLDAARFDALVRPLEMTGRGPAEDPEPPAA